MRTAIVFNHPYSGSYCNAILESVVKGLENAQHEVDLMHLDKDGFNPAMSEADLKAFVEHRPIDPQVLDYNERLKKADHLILFFRFGGILCLRPLRDLSIECCFLGWCMTIIR